MSRVLAFSCTHAPAMHKDAIKHLKRIYKKYKCNKVVMLGDLMDNGSISYHQKRLNLRNPNEEYKEAFKQIQKLYKEFPNADYLIGNHCALYLRKALDAEIPEYAMQSVSKMYKIERWKEHPRYTKLVIDGVIYTHGDQGSGGGTPALTNAKIEFKSYVQGHTHSAAGVWYHANDNDLVFGLNVGCLLDRDHLQLEYGVKFNKKPILGCGVVIDGKQGYFEPLLMK